MNGHYLTRTLTAVAVCLSTVCCLADEPFEREPISYRSALADSDVSRLLTRMAAGDVELERERPHGFLKGVLRELDVPVSSQVLVFSKTSFQASHISPRTPRAVYFNDEVYVGWVRNSPTLEISTVDVNLGAAFYSLTDERGRPNLRRETDRCLQCHVSSNTGGLPGHLVRSVFPGPTGMPVYSAGTFFTDPTSPLAERWGGWYVSGTHGDQRHMGNVFVSDPNSPELLDLDQGANVTDLSTRFGMSPYLAGHSDVVALMVLEHQVQMHNLMTAANFATRQALHYQAEMNRLFNDPEDYQSESTRSRIRNSCRRLVKAMLFCGEARLTDGVAGSSDFAKDFAARGPFDARGRSLRQFDLQSRMFKYPLSYLIYSRAFDRLPPAALDETYQQLRAILTGEDPDPDFSHLTEKDRQAILEILRETKPSLTGG